MSVSNNHTITVTRGSIIIIMIAMYAARILEFIRGGLFSSCVEKDIGILTDNSLILDLVHLVIIIQ